MDPLSPFLMTFAAGGNQSADLNKEAEDYFNAKDAEWESRESFEEPHKDFSGKISIENTSLYDRDLQKYGPDKVMEWAKKGRYNLSAKELEKEKRCYEYKMLTQMESWGCLSPEEEKRLAELRTLEEFAK